MPARLNLASSLPLPAPFAIYIEPTNICNFRCNICPESFPDYFRSAGYSTYMTQDLWHKLLPQLAAIQPKVIRFFHTGEPLLNPWLPSMISDCTRNLVSNRLELTTNGSILKGEIARAILFSGLTYLRLSVYSTTDEGYRTATGARFTASQILSNLTAFRTLRTINGLHARWHLHIHAELVSSDPADLANDAAAFRAQYTNVADTVSVKSLHNWGSADSRLVQLGHADRQVCPFPFYQMHIKANGLVSVCCVDWANQLIVGDANHESLLDIWNGDRLRSIQRAHATGNRGSIPICAGCTAFQGHPDNLDSLINININIHNQPQPQSQLCTLES